VRHKAAMARSVNWMQHAAAKPKQSQACPACPNPQTRAPRIEHLFGAIAKLGYNIAPGT